MHEYTLHGVPIKTVQSTKYLGVHVSRDLKWNTHICKTTAKSNRTLGFLKRNLRVKSPALKSKAYTTLLRPQLEYCCSIWDPRKGIENNGSHNLEKIQRRAARWALGNYEQTASVTEMLKVLNWRTLEQRRADARLSLLYKIANNLVAVDRGVNLRPPARRSRHLHKHSFIPISTSTTSHRLSFYPRTITQWNSLPLELFPESTNYTQFRHNVSTVIHSPVV